MDRKNHYEKVDHKEGAQFLYDISLIDGSDAWSKAQDYMDPLDGADQVLDWIMTEYEKDIDEMTDGSNKKYDAIRDALYEEIVAGLT